MIDDARQLMESVRAMHPAVVVLTTLLVGLTLIAVLRNVLRMIVATLLIGTVVVVAMPGGFALAKQVKNQGSWSERAQCAKAFATELDYWTGAKAATCPTTPVPQPASSPTAQPTATSKAASKTKAPSARGSAPTSRSADARWEAARVDDVVADCAKSTPQRIERSAARVGCRRIMDCVLTRMTVQRYLSVFDTDSGRRAVERCHRQVGIDGLGGFPLT